MDTVGGVSQGGEGAAAGRTLISFPTRPNKPVGVRPVKSAASGSPFLPLKPWPLPGRPSLPDSTTSGACPVDPAVS